MHRSAFEKILFILIQAVVIGWVAGCGDAGRGTATPTNPKDVTVTGDTDPLPEGDADNVPGDTDPSPADPSPAPSDGNSQPPAPVAGNGDCEPGENAATAPTDCPALIGDGLCTHTETPALSPNDCPPGAGDGYCTAPETPVTVPADCPAVAGDGLCTHNEKAWTVPNDCAAVAGDAHCTHNEKAWTVPSDCPAVSGDAHCTHGENAASTPNDCPKVNGDGFCTHNEIHFTAPSDCPPPDVVFAGGSLAQLKNYAPDLVFGDLTLNGDLRLAPSDGSVLIAAETFKAQNGGVIVERTSCDWGNAPNFKVVTSGEINISKRIFLNGRPGVPVVDTATCNSCDGSNGGDLWLEGSKVTVSAELDTDAGWGATMRIATTPTLINAGCDGGLGGDIVLKGATQVSIGAVSLSAKGGDGGDGYNASDGSRGADGKLEWTSAATTLAEKESNAPVGLAQWIAPNTLTISAAISATDDSAANSSGSGLDINLAGGGTDFVEDVFIMPVKTSTTLTLSTTVSNASTDLDLYVYSTTFVKIGESSGPTGNESVTATFAPGTYYILASWCCNTPQSNYTLKVQR